MARGLTTLFALATAAGGVLLSPAVAVAEAAADPRHHSTPQRHSAPHGTPHGAGPQGSLPRLGKCAAGELCLWVRNGFKGQRRTYELSGVTLGSCVPLSKGVSAQSFANRTGRPVTVYQSGECAETGEFHTHPSGSWTPEGEYRVRAVKIWER